MPHDRKGRLLEVGDVIITEPFNQSSYNSAEPREYAGSIVEMNAHDCQDCTGQIRFTLPGTKSEEVDYFAAGKSDLILKHDGSRPE